jgi:hypothetical protein
VIGMGTSRGPHGPRLAIARALLIYNLLATIYLDYLAVATQLTGILLWPAIAGHGVLAVLLARFGLIGSMLSLH